MIDAIATLIRCNPDGYRGMLRTKVKEGTPERYEGLALPKQGEVIDYLVDIAAMLGWKIVEWRRAV